MMKGNNMRKSIYILILILFTSTCFAGGVTDKVKSVIARKNAAPALTCSRATQQSPTDAVDFTTAWSLGEYSTTDWKASEFVYGGPTGTLCSVDIGLKKDASPTGTLTIYLYNDTGPSTSPSTARGTIGTKDVSTLDGTTTWYTFSCDIAITNGATYWIVLYFDNPNATNFVRFGIDSECATEHIVYGADGSSWADDLTTFCQSIKLYIKE